LSGRPLLAAGPARSGLWNSATTLTKAHTMD
jgi:hypothetical protein